MVSSGWFDLGPKSTSTNYSARHSPSWSTSTKPQKLADSSPRTSGRDIRAFLGRQGLNIDHDDPEDDEIDHRIDELADLPDDVFTSTMNNPYRGVAIRIISYPGRDLPFSCCFFGHSSIREHEGEAEVSDNPEREEDGATYFGAAGRRFRRCEAIAELDIYRRIRS